VEIKISNQAKALPKNKWWELIDLINTLINLLSKTKELMSNNKMLSSTVSK
jgi:hypothetical protein